MLKIDEERDVHEVAKSCRMKDLMIGDSNERWMLQKY